MLDELVDALKQGVRNALQKGAGITAGGSAERQAAVPAATGAGATASGPAPERDPLGLAGRRMPAGDTVDAVLPVEVGNFVRSRVNDRFGGIRSGGIFAGYRGEGIEIRLLVTLYRDAATAREQVRQQCGVQSLGTEPSYSIAPGSVVWSRGAYCFSASSADTEGDVPVPATPAQVAALDRFMAAFPY